MADANRTLVDKLVLHHAVTPTWEDKSKAWLAQWFSDNGFVRGYSSKPANWSGLINPYTGQRSYSQAHFAGQRVDGSTPDATDEERAKGYRLVPLVSDPWGQICWHAGNWPVNQGSIGIENLGDYRGLSLRENDCKVLADFWRQRDRELGGKTAVYGHQEVSQLGTACPCNIMNARNRIVDLINAGDSGWPAPTPPPAPVQQPEPEKPKPVEAVTGESYGEGKKFVVLVDTRLKNIPDGSDATSEVYAAGRIIENVVEKISWSNSLTFVRTAYSKQNNLARGFLYDTLKEVVAQSPEPETKPEAPVTNEPTQPVPEQPAEPANPTVPTTPEPTKKPPLIVLLIAWLLSKLARKKK